MSPAIGRREGTPLRVGRFLRSVVVLVGIGVVIPLAAVTAAQRRFGSWNPLAGVQAPWRWNLGSALREPLEDGTVVDVLIRVSIVAALAASAVVVITTVIELVYLVRDGGLRRPTAPGLGWATAIGRYIAIGLLVVVPLANPKVAVAGTAPSISHVVPDAVAPSTTAAVSSPDAEREVSVFGAGGQLPSSEQTHRDERVDAGHYVVQRGDSVWSIAERLGSGDASETMILAERILDANLGRTMADGRQFTNPALIDIGWELLIPPDIGAAQSQVETDGSPSALDDGGTAADAGRAMHSVMLGDTLWDIAERYLGDGTAWTSIWELNGGRQMADGAVFDDPDVIVPGWVLELPQSAEAEGDADAVLVDTVADDSPPAASPDRPATTAAPTDVDSDAGQDSSAPDAVPSVPTPTAATPAPTGPPPDAVGTMPSDLETDPAEAAPQATSADTAPPVDDDASVAPDVSHTGSPAGDDATAGGVAGSASTSTSSPTPAGHPDDHEFTPASSSSTSPVRLEHAALLAAGVLALVGVRRRARLRTAPPHSRLPAPNDAHAATERRLRLSDPGERLLRLDVAMRAIATQLSSDEVRIGWIELGDDGDIRVQLTAPAALPSPWTGDGARWTLDAAVPIELLAADARQAGMPCSALVQIGITDDGADVLVDLEACRTLTVAGSIEQVRPIVTATATGLAASTYAEVANLIVVGLSDTVTLQHRNAHRATDVAGAMRLARSLAPQLPDGRSTFGLRTRRTGGEAWEPTIVIAADSGASTSPEPPPPGVALVVIDTTDNVDVDPTPGPRLALADRTWRLDAFGASCTLTPIGVTEQDLADVSGLLEECTAPIESSGELDDLQPQWHDDHEVDDADRYAGLDHAIVVGLVGPMTITDSDGNLATFERSKTVELIAWLATHRDRATRSGARAALWEIDVRDATFANVVSEARRGLARLSPPPAGNEWIPRTLSDALALDDRVVTDAALIEHRLQHARLQPPQQAIDTLRPAVERIRGLPFSGTNYLWPEVEGTSSQLVLLAITAASELAGHALSLGDTELVFWATGKGLAVLPGHEELVGLRMRAYARTGDLAGVRNEWEQYERVLTADPWSDGEPAEKLVELRQELLGSRAN